MSIDSFTEIWWCWWIDKKGMGGGGWGYEWEGHAGLGWGVEGEIVEITSPSLLTILLCLSSQDCLNFLWGPIVSVFPRHQFCSCICYCRIISVRPWHYYTRYKLTIFSSVEGHNILFSYEQFNLLIDRFLFLIQVHVWLNEIKRSC